MSAALLAMVVRYWFSQASGLSYAAEVVAQRLGHLAHFLDEVALALFAGGDPDDAVGKGPPHDFVFGEGLGQHGFADAAHAVYRCKRDGLTVVFGKQSVAQRLQSFGALQVVGYARRGGEVGDGRFPIGVRQRGGGVATDVADEFLKSRLVVGWDDEVAILTSVQVDRPVGAFHGYSEHGNDANTQIQTEKLLCAANLRGVRSRDS